MFLISEPESRLIVSSTETDGHETTLVVPELSRTKLEYYKCLVDPGTAFKEHAVVIWEGPLEGENDALLVVRALNAARPTEVSFLAEGQPKSIDGGKASDTGTAACAVVSRWEILKNRPATAFGLSVTKTGRFYTCAR